MIIQSRQKKILSGTIEMEVILSSLLTYCHSLMAWLCKQKFVKGGVGLQ